VHTAAKFSQENSTPRVRDYWRLPDPQAEVVALHRAVLAGCMGVSESFDLIEIGNKDRNVRDDKCWSPTGRASS